MYIYIYIYIYITEKTLKFHVYHEILRTPLHKTTNGCCARLPKIRSDLLVSVADQRNTR